MKILAVLVAWLLVPSLTAQQLQKSAVGGVVVNPDGEPIPNIRVELGKLGVELGPIAQFLAGAHERTITAEDLVRLKTLVLQPRDLPPELELQRAALRSIPFDEIYEVVFTASGVPSVVYKALPPVTTDSLGRFSFAGIDAGRYTLTFSGTGYASQDYASGASLTLPGDKPNVDVVMRLVKLGAISGTIRDADGQAVVGVPVELLSFKYDQNGQKTNERIAITRTDDSGAYRVFAVPPGNYYVRAGGQAGTPGSLTQRNVADALYSNRTGSISGGYSTPNRFPQVHALTYYPGTPDVASATAIELRPGADLRGIDLLVALQLPFRLSGRVVDSRTGKPPQRVVFELNPKGFTGPGTNLLTGPGGFNPNYKTADGTFEIQGVNPREYVFVANIPDEPNFGIRMPLTLNADANGIVLALRPGGNLKGRVRIESNSRPGATVLASVRVQLRSETNGFIQTSALVNDGSFQIDQIQQDDYRLSVVGLAEGFYMKEAKLGETDVLNDLLHYDASGNATLNILFSPNAGAVNGMAMNTAGQPLPGARVVLIPQNRHRTDLFQSVIADAGGRFTISSVAPGEYTLGAWELLEPYAFFDPAVMRQAEEQGKPVQVGESSNQRITVSAIPAR